MDLVAVFAVFALFVFMLSLLCFCVIPFFSVNKDLYILPDKYFKTVFFEWVKSYMAVCFNYFWSIAIFLNIDISQNSVATCLRCGGILRICCKFTTKSARKILKIG